MASERYGGCNDQQRVGRDGAAGVVGSGGRRKCADGAQYKSQSTFSAPLTHFQLTALYIRKP